MIRQAILQDEPAVRACAEQAYARYIPILGKKPAPLLADFGAQIADGIIHVAANDDDNPLGFIVFYAVEDGMLLENVAVLPSAAGRGIGKSLITYCETTAQQQGHACVKLYTHEKMIENIAMYKRLGYQEIKRITEHGFQRVYFEKDLKSKT